MYHDNKSFLAVALTIALSLATTNCDVGEPDTSELSEESKLNGFDQDNGFNQDNESSEDDGVDQDNGFNQDNESSEDDGVDQDDESSEDDGVDEDDESSEKLASPLGPVVETTLNYDGWLCGQGRPVFEDEFDTMDWNAWKLHCGAGMVREAECRKENVFVKGGELNIRSKRIGNTNKYTSAGIVSKKGLLKEGRTVCIEAKLPGVPGRGNGLWPALWFMGGGDYKCWPHGGEIDLLEMIDADGVVHNVFHYIKGHVHGVTKPNCYDYTKDQKGELHARNKFNSDWFNQYHEYALKMTKDTIIYYLDGKETHRVRNGQGNAHIDTGSLWDIRINTAVGGNWPNPVDSSTVNDTRFKIRSVRVVESADDQSNIARGKTTHQSSTAEGGGASRAVDGNNNGDFRYGSTTHTTNQSEPWWMVDLGREYDIAQVSIFNRKDCCGERLRDYDVEYLDGNQHFIESLHYPGEQRLVQHHVLNVHGVRYVRIKRRGKGVLSLAEVQIYPTNLARGKSASQSSTEMGGVASRAVDGNTNGGWGSNSTTHTRTEAKPWWMVDLGRKHNIARVSIFNRTDCCSSRLRNYNVEYLDASRNIIDEVEFPDEQGDVAHHVYFVPDVRYVRVKLNEPGVLSLAEVQIFSDRTNSAAFDDSDNTIIPATVGSDISANGRSNIAKGKTAHQSSSEMGGIASRAVDGNTDGGWGKASTTHTRTEAEPWWIVDLGREHDIAQVSTFNRTDCCGFRLNNYDVEYLDGNQHLIESLHFPGTQGRVEHHLLNVYGVRYVRVKLNEPGALSLAEVEVYPMNVAHGKRAWQSSSEMGGVASRAVDGNTNGGWGSNSTTHTRTEAEPWWIVDLGGEFDIARVSTFNRTDCCSSRLSNYNVEYLDGSHNVIESIHYPGEQGGVEHHVHNVPGVSYVRIKLNEPGVLSLAEVQVITTTTPIENNGVPETPPGDAIFTHGSEVNYHLGGIVQGLTGGNLVLREKPSGREIVVATNGRFSLGQRFPEGSVYDVEIVSSPSISFCSIGNDQGLMPATANHGVQIHCTQLGITIALSNSNGQANCFNFGDNGTAAYPTRYHWGAGGLCGFTDSNNNGSNHDELLDNRQAVFRVVRLKGGNGEYVLINESERRNQCVNFGDNATAAHPSRYNWNWDAGDLCSFPDKNKDGSNHDDILANRQAVFKLVPLDGGDNEYVLINESQKANQCVNFGNNGTDAHPTRYNWGHQGVCGFPDTNNNGSNHDEILANGQAVFKMHQLFAPPTDDGTPVEDPDVDGDGMPDGDDGCPEDPWKTTAGICGCGVDDIDTDDDGTPNCDDDCPADPWKTTAGFCGCGVDDIDTDGDGTPDCDDGCPADPEKTSAGFCGCGDDDTDTDGDGTPDCDFGQSVINIALSYKGQVNCVNFGNNGTAAHPTHYNWGNGGLCGFPDLNNDGSNHDELLANRQAVFRAVKLEGGSNEFVLINESTGANQCLNFGNNATAAHPTRYNWGHQGVCGFPDTNNNGSNHDELLANRQAVFRFVPLDGGDNNYVLLNESQSANQCLNFGNNGTAAHPTRYNWGAKGLCGFPDANNNGSNHDEILANGQAVFKMHQLVVE